MKISSLLISLVFSFSAFALTTGTPAPDFKLKSASGKEVSLSEYKGKFVVLEWYNPECPFVKKHYGSNNMQSLQKKYTDKSVVWLSIVSSAEGKQGYMDAKAALAEKEKSHSSATEILLDTSGTVGKQYEAKTTPHMFVIDKAGVLAYQGAIDSTPDTNVDSVASAKNYVTAALDELIANKKVTQATTQSYGCSVKY